MALKPTVFFHYKVIGCNSFDLRSFSILTLHPFVSALLPYNRVKWWKGGSDIPLSSPLSSLLSLSLSSLLSSLPILSRHLSSSPHRSSRSIVVERESGILSPLLSSPSISRIYCQSPPRKTVDCCTQRDNGWEWSWIRYSMNTVIHSIIPGILDTSHTLRAQPIIDLVSRPIYA